MLRSLTSIVAVELAAVGLGLGLAPPVPAGRAEAMKSLRKRWLFVLVTFLVASIFVLAWMFTVGFGARAGTQALGLALLAGLPLYACGYLLAAISADDLGIGSRSTGAFATIGAAGGVLVTGLSSLGRVGVPSLMFLMLMLLSGGALVQAWLIDNRASLVVSDRESEVR